MSDTLNECPICFSLSLRLGLIQGSRTHQRAFKTNTPNGSWGIVHVLPTTQMAKELDAPRIHLSSVVQVRSRRVGLSVTIASSRLDLNKPPTAVGGIRVTVR